MADKTVSIKTATDKELNALIGRVRAEREALSFLREQKIQSTPNPKGQYPVWQTMESFSTETPVSNGKSIKAMTDEELSAFITRLRNESELTRLVRDIKDMNSPVNNSIDGNIVSDKMYEGINLNTPVDNLYHWGIPGMKWYVNRSKEQILVDKKQYESGATVAKEYTNVMSIAGRRQSEKFTNLKRMEAKSLSDEDLKKIVGRLNMEQQYRNLASADVKQGKSRTEDILGYIGSAMTIAAAGAGLALTIKQLLPADVAKKALSGG